MPPRKRIVKGNARSKSLDLEHPKAADKRRRTYSVRDLGLTGKSLGTIFNQLDRDSDKIDELKLPTERWGLQIAGKNSYIVTNSMSRLARGGFDSGTLRDLTMQKQRNIIRSLKIVKIHSGDGPTTTEKKIRKQRESNIKKYDRIRKKKAEEKADKKNAKLLKQLKQKEAEIKRLQKAAAKRASKKKPAKKTVPKKGRK